MRSRAMRAPTTSWKWNDTPSPVIERVFGLPTSWNSAASRRHLVGRGVLDDGDGVREHVLVPVDRVLLERSAGSSGRNSAASPVSTRNHRPAAGASSTDQLVELVAHALRRHDLQPAPQRLDGGDQRGIGLQAVPGDEPGRPHHAQRIVAERLLRRQRRAQSRRGQVGDAIERVDQRGVRAARAPWRSR